MKIKILDCKLLSVKEANKVDVSIRDMGHSWWLRSHSNNPYYAACIVDGGGVFAGGVDVDFDIGVRPALYLESNARKSFKLAGHNWVNVFDNVYLCKNFIGNSVFNDSIDDGNDYEDSVIQKYVLSWFKSQGLEFYTEINLNDN